MNEADTPTRSINLDTVLSLPLVKLGMFAGALVTAGWLARQSLDQLNTHVGQVGTSVETIRHEVGRLRADMTAEIARRTHDQWTRTDQKLWSYELHRANAGQLNVPAVLDLTRPNQ